MRIGEVNGKTIVWLAELENHELIKTLIKHELWNKQRTQRTHGPIASQIEIVQKDSTLRP